MIHNPDKTIWVFDGSHYLFRAYYAISELMSPDGVPTNAIFGFLRMFLYLAHNHDMKNAFVVWDSKEPSWRKIFYEAYKAHREEMPEDLQAQVPHLFEILRLMKVPQYLVDGYEADDLIYSCVAPCLEHYDQVVLVTNDKDLYQLIRAPQVIGFHPQLKVFVDDAYVQKKYGVRPNQMRDYLTLVGDASDGVPGVPGVGAKTAAKLLAQYADIKEIVANADAAVMPARSRGYVKDDTDALWQSYELIGLVEHAESFKEIRPQDNVLIKVWDEALWDKLSALGLNSVKAELKELTSGKTAEKTDADTYMADEARQPASKKGAAFEGHSLSMTESGALVLQSPDGTTEEVDAAQVLDWAARNGDAVYFVYDYKRLLHRHPDLAPVWDRVYDLMLLEYLTDPERFVYDESVVLGPRAYAMRPDMSAIAGEFIYQSIEQPLTPVLFQMERRGITIDIAAVDRLRQKWQQTLDALQARLHEMAGVEFNILSTKQVAAVLFEKCGLPIVKKTKTGPSVDAESLDQLKGMHPIVPPLIEYRELAKMLNTYTDGLTAHADADAVLHTDYLQYGTASGRLSSRAPNLQNIPQRGQHAESLRACFVPRAGHVFVSVDYNQIELRILAHLCGAPSLIETFSRNEDIHVHTAVELFGAQAKDDAAMRGLAKTINFGVLYGQTPYGLSRIAGISVADAKDYIARYFARYPEVKAFQERVMNDAQRHGLVKTLYGRARKISTRDLEMSSRDRGHALRAAFNTVLQGSCADIIKLAMIQTAPVAAARGGALVLQIHDELVFEMPQAALDESVDMIRKEMENIVQLTLPLTVHVRTGKF